MFPKAEGIEMKFPGRSWLFLLLVLLALAVGYYLWDRLAGQELPPGFASGNGRIEAVEIDVSTKTPGRVVEILVREGDFVEPSQVLARMDTNVLEAQLREAQAQLRRAEIAVEAARSTVTQREAERAAAEAVVAQREAELDGAQSRLVRSQELAPRGTVPVQRLDDDRALAQSARAAVSAAQAQVAAAEAAIAAAKAKIIDAEAEVEAVKATIQRIEADIDDSYLRAPRAGRVQYRVAELGEVLPAGGRVLNLVDLGDVYMTFFLPTAEAGRVAIGSEVRLVMDAAPEHVIPARATFVADVAQFTPRTVETTDERLKLMFRIRARIDPALLEEYITQVKTGLPGTAYVRLEPEAKWPEWLELTLQP
ncbi:MAG TPA: HlyD family efflux transporter periplasmic adaptor subunit [Kiloniellales bacterium]|jgi:HlyD family secretion protein|nr:HlyD family efflux transporter periplasmic adaptor subunit [Kiloniellales bacterium]